MSNPNDEGFCTWNLVSSDNSLDTSPGHPGIKVFRRWNKLFICNLQGHKQGVHGYVSMENGSGGAVVGNKKFNLCVIFSKIHKPSVQIITFLKKIRKPYLTGSK